MDASVRLISKQTLRGVRKYLKPIFVVLSIFIIVCAICLVIVKQESMKNAAKTANYFIQNIDSQLINLTSNSYGIINNDKAREISSLLKEDPDNKEAYSSQCIQLSTYAREFCMANPIVQDVVFYYPKHDLVVDRYGHFNARKFSAISNLDSILTGEVLDNYANSIFNHEHNCFFTMESSGGEPGAFFFYRSSPDNVPIEKAERILILKFNKSRIAQMMEELAALMNQNYICMLTDDGKVFVEAGSPSYLDTENGDLFYMGNSLGSTIASNTASMTHSDIWNMDVYLEPNLSEIERFLKTITLILAIGIVIACGLGILFAAGDYRKTLSIVKPILDKTGGAHGDENSKSKDIDELMADRLSSYYESNSRQSKTIDEQKSQIAALKKEYSALEKLIQEANLRPDGEKAIENDKIYENVADYACKLIENGFADPAMGLAMIADIIGVSQAYLSRAFKKEKEKNISVYLSEVRIQHAKELLRCTNDNISTIAEKTGFVSDVTFIRVFKKIEGDTPNTYRKNAQSN